MIETRRLILAADHAGLPLKQLIRGWLEAWGHKVEDLGTHAPDSVDYPDFGRACAEAVVAAGPGKALGIVVCGSGIGISIAANRVKGARCALCADSTAARLSRQHNDANMLALGARLVGEEVAKDILAAFLSAQFEGGRHERRIAKLDAAP